MLGPSENWQPIGTNRQKQIIPGKKLWVQIPEPTIKSLLGVILSIIWLCNFYSISVIVLYLYVPPETLVRIKIFKYFSGFDTGIDTQLAEA